MGALVKEGFELAFHAAALFVGRGAGGAERSKLPQQSSTSGSESGSASAKTAAAKG